MVIEQWMYDLTVDEAHTFFVGQQGWLVHNCKKYQRPKSKVSGKDGAKDVPDWAKRTGERPYVGERGRDFAKRILDARYGPGNYDRAQDQNIRKLKSGEIAPLRIQNENFHG